MLRVSPAKYMAVRAMTIDRGIDSAMITVIRKRRRKKNRIPAASRAPILPLSSSVPIDYLITVDWVNRMPSSEPASFGFLTISSKAASSFSPTSMVLAWPSV